MGERSCNEAHAFLSAAGVPLVGTLKERIERFAASLSERLDRFACAGIDETSPLGVLEARIRRALSYIGEIESEGSNLADLCQKAHDALDACGVPNEGAPAERIARMAIEAKNAMLDRDKAVADLAKLQAERDEAQRLADFWMSEAKNAIQARDEARHDLLHTRSERELALMRTLADLGMIWSKGVRP